MIGLLVAVLLAQQPVPSTLVPPASEERVVFSHAGFTYFVGKTSGSVIAVEQGAGPIPPPVPDDSPVRPQPATGTKWFSVILDETKPEQQAWRTDLEIRKSLESLGVQFRTYVAGEADIDRLGFRTTVGQTGLPVVILQDQSGKMIKAVSPKTKDDILKIVELIK